jgi:hypothetical protein
LQMISIVRELCAIKIVGFDAEAELV